MAAMRMQFQDSWAFYSTTQEHAVKGLDILIQTTFQSLHESPALLKMLLDISQPTACATGAAACPGNTRQVKWEVLASPWTVGFLGAAVGWLLSGIRGAFLGAASGIGISKCWSYCMTPTGLQIRISQHNQGTPLVPFIHQAVLNLSAFLQPVDRLDHAFWFPRPEPTRPVPASRVHDRKQNSRRAIRNRNRTAIQNRNPVSMPGSFSTRNR